MVAEEREDENLDECQVYATELENLNPFDAIKLSPERLVQLQTCTSQDPVLMALKTTVITGWPEITKQVPMLESISFFEMRSLNTMEYSSRITELFFQSCYEQRFCPEFTLVTWMQSSVSGKPDMLYFGQE